MEFKNVDGHEHLDLPLIKHWADTKCHPFCGKIVANNDIQHLRDDDLLDGTANFTRVRKLQHLKSTSACTKMTKFIPITTNSESLSPLDSRLIAHSRGLRNCATMAPFS
jgi:hypothetical protein